MILITVCINATTMTIRYFSMLTYYFSANEKWNVVLTDRHKQLLQLDVCCHKRRHRHVYLYIVIVTYSPLCNQTFFTCLLCKDIEKIID